MKNIVILVIKAYQKVISPLTSPCCRFAPSCSFYAIQALQEHGVIKGLYLTMKRVFRCHPWGAFGEDPIPKKVSEDV